MRTLEIGSRRDHEAGGVSTRQFLRFAFGLHFRRARGPWPDQIRTFGSKEAAAGTGYRRGIGENLAAVINTIEASGVEQESLAAECLIAQGLAVHKVGWRYKTRREIREGFWIRIVRKMKVFQSDGGADESSASLGFHGASYQVALALEKTRSIPSLPSESLDP